MTKEIIINKKITTEQKIKFFEFCLNIFTGEIKQKISDEFSDTFYQDLKDYGFCLVYRHFFDEYSNNFILLPELKKHKPKKNFYNYDGTKSNDNYQFWFPLGGKQTQRINLCKKILAELK